MNFHGEFLFPAICLEKYYTRNVSFKVSGKSKYLQKTEKIFLNDLCVIFLRRITFFNKKISNLCNIERKKKLCVIHRVISSDLYSFQNKKKKM